MKTEYEPKTRRQFYGYLIEECGEVMQAVGKTLRWGEHSTNPDPGASEETNLAWVLREIHDLDGAIVRFKSMVDAEIKCSSCGQGVTRHSDDWSELQYRTALGGGCDKPLSQVIEENTDFTAEAKPPAYECPACGSASCLCAHGFA